MVGVFALHFIRALFGIYDALDLVRQKVHRRSELCLF